MPERQCQSCTRQEEWGCRARQVFDEGQGKLIWENPARLPQDVDGEETFACPRQPLHEAPLYWAEVLFYYNFYKKGMLPSTGGVRQQSNWAMQVFSILDGINAECDAVEREKAARKKANPNPYGPRGR